MAYPRISFTSSTKSDTTALNVPHRGKILPAPGWKHAEASRKPGLGSCRIVFLLHPTLRVESGRRYPSVLDVRYGVYPPQDGIELLWSEPQTLRIAHMISRAFEGASGSVAHTSPKPRRLNLSMLSLCGVGPRSSPILLAG